MVCETIAGIFTSKFKRTSYFHWGVKEEKEVSSLVRKAIMDYEEKGEKIKKEEKERWVSI